MRSYQGFWEVLKTKGTVQIDAPADKHHQIRVLIRRETNRDVLFMNKFRGKFYISASSLGNLLRLFIVYKD